MQELNSVNPQLDLVFEKTVSLPMEKLWKGWTDPQTLMQWFCPKPWKVTDCRIELRPGGEFYTQFEGPNGEKMPNSGCYLEVVENQKIVWTGMLTKGFRPTPASSLGFAFVATILFSKVGNQISYKAIVRHGDEQGRKQHEEMGFQEGWGKAFDQLIELIKAGSV